MDHPDLLGIKILEKRKMHKLTQVELGKRIGVSGGAISQFEKSVSKPTEQTLKKLSEVLNYDFELLINGERPANMEEEHDYVSADPGSFLEQARKKKNLSQAQLADLVGVSRASISLYETGAGSPSFRVLGKLADVLDFSFLNLANIAQDHYSGVMLTQEGFVDMNIIRSSLIKDLFHRQENYVEVEFLMPTRPLPNTALSTSQTMKRYYQEFYKEGVDMTLGIDPYREIDVDSRWPTVSVLAVEGVDYSDAGIFIVRDNKMGQRYPENSRHVFHPIKDRNQWKYLTGINGLFINGNTIIIRRIVSNRNNFLDLADADGNVMSVLLDDITMVWRVGQTIHMPAEK